MTRQRRCTLTHSDGYGIAPEEALYVAWSLDEGSDLELVADSLDALVAAIETIGCDESREMQAKPGWLRTYYEWERGLAPGRIHVTAKPMSDEVVSKILSFAADRGTGRRRAIDRLAAVAMPLAGGCLLALDMIDGVIDLGGILGIAVSSLI